MQKVYTLTFWTTKQKRTFQLFGSKDIQVFCPNSIKYLHKQKV